MMDDVDLSEEEDRLDKLVTIKKSKSQLAAIVEEVKPKSQPAPLIGAAIKDVVEKR